MENILHTLGSSPLLLGICLLLLFILLISLVMRLAKLAVVMLIVLLGYAGYLDYTGQAVPKPIQHAEETLRQSARNTGRSLKKNAVKAGKAVETVAEELGEKLVDSGRHPLDFGE